MLFASIKPVFLITDLILFGMLSIALLYAIQARKDLSLHKSGALFYPIDVITLHLYWYFFQHCFD